MKTQLLTVAVVTAPIKNTKNKPKHVGWLIYCPDRKEFVCTHQCKSGLRSTTTYTKDPSLAFCYNSSYLAVHDSSNIDQFTEVVPSFDQGDKVGVDIPNDYFGCVCIITKQQLSTRMRGQG